MIEHYYSKTRPVLIKNIVLKRYDGAAKTNLFALNSASHSGVLGIYRRTLWVKSKRPKGSLFPIRSMLENMYSQSSGYAEEFLHQGILQIFPKLEQAGFIQAALDIEAEVAVFQEMHKEYFSEIENQKTRKKVSNIKQLKGKQDMSFDDLM